MVSMWLSYKAGRALFSGEYGPLVQVVNDGILVIPFMVCLEFGCAFGVRHFAMVVKGNEDGVTLVLRALIGIQYLAVLIHGAKIDTYQYEIVIDHFF